MGSVSIDIHKNEREFRHLTLSDAEVVKYLILFRSRVDANYGSETNININQAGDTYELNQELIALYASLDVTVIECNFNEKQLRLLELLFEGNTIADSVNHYNYPKKTAYRMVDKIVDSIVEKSNYNWKKSIHKQGYIG